MAALARPTGTLPSNTQQNPRPQFSQGHKYTPLLVRNEQAKAIATRTGRSYDPPPMPNVVVSDVQDKGSDDVYVDEEIDMEEDPTVKTPVTPPKLVVAPEGMPNYAKFIKELVTDKGKFDEAKATFLYAECFAMLQNRIPPKLEDPGSLLITCSIRTLTSKVLADLGASINLMPYSVYIKLVLGVLRPTRMSIRLADHSFQYPIGIAENMTT
uniref:uncharacterized protein LOC122609021 n=1 Tax=Erigeron canadensis TaxID=72917 RepID=UPI001CB97904|nr:uncharacterized protein LOC122609021 [Erigeron canadensis]